MRDDFSPCTLRFVRAPLPNLVPRFSLLPVSLAPLGRVGENPGNEVVPLLARLISPSNVTFNWTNIVFHQIQV